MTDDRGTDLELSQRLERLASAVPIDHPGELQRLAPRVRGRLTGRRLALTGVVPLVAVLVAGTLLADLARVGPFAPGATDSSPTVMASDVPVTAEPNPPQVATDVDGDFELTIRSGKRRYVPDEVIDVSATLVYRGTRASVQVDGIWFGSRERVFGEVRLDTTRLSICTPGLALERGGSLDSPFRKNGGFPGDHPDTESFKAFMHDPVLRLPPGTWHLYAVATSPCPTGPALDSPRFSVEAEIEIAVVDPAGATATPSTTISPTSDAATQHVRGATRSGGYELAIETTQATYREGEWIDPLLTVTNVGFDEAPFVLAASPLVLLSVRQVDGPGVATARAHRGCGPFGSFERDVPHEMQFSESRAVTSGWTDEQLRRYRAGGHVVRPEDATPDGALILPPGTWVIRADSRLFGPECDAPQVIDLSAEVTVTVVP